jgi:aspartate/methionine/tyrosine aminotransferase
MPRLPDFKLETFFSRWEFNARYHMTASDAESMTMHDLLAMADNEDRQAWDQLRLGYTQTWGSPALRDTIAATYRGISADDILCFAGAEEGLWCAMHALLEPGDHAIVTVPNYQSMETVPALLCSVTGLAMHPERDWAVDLNELIAAIRPNTRLLALNFPNNPTGAVPDKEQFLAIIELCRQRGIYIFSDEVYRGIERDPTHTLPQLAEVYERGISLNVVSKAYGLPGLRIGWIACRDHDFLQRMERIKHYLSICNSAPSEVLARIAIKARAQIFDRNRARCARNLSELEAFFQRWRHLYQWKSPPGSCVGFVRYLGSDGVEAHCRDLVEQSGVLLLPASVYQSDLLPVVKDYFRVGYGREGLDAGLGAWDRHLSRIM